MKYSLIILLILITVSCTDKSSKSLEKNLELREEKKGSNNSLESRLQKDWTVVALGLAHCDACPKVSFKEGGKGLVILPTNTSLHFSWSVVNDSTIRVESFDSEIILFSLKDYKVKIEEHSSSVGLTLISIDGLNEYVLRRSI